MGRTFPGTLAVDSFKLQWGVGRESWRAAYEVSMVILRVEGALLAGPYCALTSEALWVYPEILGLGASVVREVAAEEASRTSRELTLREYAWMFATAAVGLADLAVTGGRPCG
jgi:hypothetical protein